ncbi:MAG: CBS domain-containing protein [Acetobacteraceae bacterium]|nr:CBS domain-containing protein [Acetobacteraceae bacterium]
MIAADVMVRDVVTIGPDESVARAARLMTENDVSALPVVGADGGMVGIISEADLLRREEIGTAGAPARWMETMTPATALAAEFTRSHGKRVADLMSENVISVSEDTSLNEIAALLERSRIKRVPVVRDSKLVGIVSRSNLIQALASAAVKAESPSDESRLLREELLERLKQQSWADYGNRNVIVRDGEVHLWGLVGSEEERKALVTLAEGVPGVTKVVDETIHAEWSDAEPAGQNNDSASTEAIATAATVAVVGIGAVALEAALLPGLVLGVAAAWLPTHLPTMFRSTIRGVQKTLGPAA